MALTVAGLAYLAAHGARTPLLALRGLLRLRNVVLVLVPAIATAVVPLLLEGRVDDRVRQGAVALAVVPAPLFASALVGRIGRRGDLAGALVLGTVLISMLVVGSRGAPAAAALFAATLAFAIAAMVANAMPTIRDALLVPIRWVGRAGAVGVGVFALLDRPPIDLAVIAAALALLGAGALTAAAVARLQRRDIVAAVGGAGMRDPVLAIGLAAVAFGPGSAGVPIAYTGFCLALAAFALARR